MSKLDRVMSKSGIWPSLVAYFVPIDGHFAQMFRDMDFTFVFPIIHSNFDIQTNLKSIGPKLTILFLPQKSLKWPYLKSQFCPSVINQKDFANTFFD